MDVIQFTEYCRSKAGVTEGFPFDETTLVFKVGGKMFALCGLDGNPLFVNLKCDPEKSITLREEYDGIIFPGYHMNKKHWNSVYLEADLEMKLYCQLIDESYNLIRNSLPKKVQEELDGLDKNG
jgi:predicted DNA-binding protein (MmcQ/YjbR family)